MILVNSRGGSSGSSNGALWTFTQPATFAAFSRNLLTTNSCIVTSATSSCNLCRTTSHPNPASFADWAMEFLDAHGCFVHINYCLGLPAPCSDLAFTAPEERPERSGTRSFLRNIYYIVLRHWVLFGSTSPSLAEHLTTNTHRDLVDRKHHSRYFLVFWGFFRITFRCMLVLSPLLY